MNNLLSRETTFECASDIGTHITAPSPLQPTIKCLLQTSRLLQTPTQAPPIHHHPKATIQLPHPSILNTIPRRSPPTMTTTYTQHHLTLPSLGRGSHLITDHITSSLPQLSGIKCGLLHLFLQHTSCALSMNENWDDDVRADMSDALDGIVKEDKGAWVVWRGVRPGRVRRQQEIDGCYNC